MPRRYRGYRVIVDFTVESQPVTRLPGDGGGGVREQKMLIRDAVRTAVEALPADLTISSMRLGTEDLYDDEEED